MVTNRIEHPKQVIAAILQAKDQERTKIGLELHDNVNQLLTTAKLLLEMLKPSMGNDLMVVHKTKEIIVTAIDEIRSISRDIVLPHLKSECLIENIQRTIDDINMSGFYTIDFSHHGNDTKSIEEGIKVAIYRILQEQLKNIIKHSQAKKVDVKLQIENDYISFAINDNGIGFDPAKKNRGLGLSNIYDRTQLYNGTVDLKTAPGKGCSLSIIIPLPAA